MPHLCCVPKCRGNYPDGPKVAVFSFPKDPEFRQKWIRAIKRKHFTPSASSRVCELHFQHGSIETKTTYRNDTTGEILEAPLKRPRLAFGAVPSKLPGCPSYLSKPEKPQRMSPISKKLNAECRNIKRAIAESIETSANYNTKISFTSIDQAFEKMDLLEEGWVKVRGKANLCFFYLDETPGDYCVIKVSVILSEVLSVNVFLGELQLKTIPSSDDKSVLKLPLEVSDTVQLSHILSASKKHLCETVKMCGNQDKKVSLVCDLLESLLEKFPDKKDSVKFLQEQIGLLCVSSENRLRYSWETSLFACLLHSISPHAYKFLRSSSKIILPSPRTIKTICASFSTDPRFEQSDSSFLKYASNKYKLLDENDKTVLLMLDEIHIRPNIDYKGGNIVGEAFNNPADRATSAHVFMVNSLRSDYKDVVHILPTRTLLGEELHGITKKVIIGLGDIGFDTVAIVTDNNSLNRKAMSYFANTPEVLNEYPHPCNPEKPLFYVIDPVHILKNIRNNWINQKDQVFVFPDTDVKNTERIASFHALKEMHSKEKHQLLKYGHTLSLKALYPSSMERQNVKLVLQVFNHNIVTALQELGPKLSLTSHKDTALFISNICKWWDIVNVKTPMKGLRLRNKYQEPVTKHSEHIFNYLNNFLTWMKNWKKYCDENGITSGKLTRETHDALYHTTSALMKLSSYCLDVKNFNYLLLGQVQTDKLEERFGRYRYQAGAQYHIYIRQVFEIESKLRIGSVIPLIMKSKKYGDVCITKEDISSFINNYNIEDSHECTESPNKICINLKMCGIVTEDDISSIRENEWAPLVYVAGYSAYSVLKKIKCDYCQTFLTSAHESDDFKSSSNINTSLITANSRGGLCYPSEMVVKISAYAYVIAQKLLNNENEFLKQSSQQQVLYHLVYSAITTDPEMDIFLGHSNLCHSESYLLKMVIKPLTNILLKNYCKKRNDMTTIKSMPDIKRVKKK